jgi:adenosylcobinamide-GDP ribazoletransferase
MATVAAGIIVLVVWPIKGLLIMFLSGSAGYLFCKYVSSRLQGITGDTLGAANELVEIATLFLICIL